MLEYRTNQHVWRSGCRLCNEQSLIVKNNADLEASCLRAEVPDGGEQNVHFDLTIQIFRGEHFCKKSCL